MIVVTSKLLYHTISKYCKCIVNCWSNEIENLWPPLDSFNAKKMQNRKIPQLQGTKVTLFQLRMANDIIKPVNIGCKEHTVAVDGPFGEKWL